MSQLTSLINRTLFVVAGLLACLALWEKLANLFGYTVLQGMYAPWRLLEFAAVSLLFVYALLLREIQHTLVSKRSM
jgi:hypothetical protein